MLKALSAAVLIHLAKEGHATNFPYIKGRHHEIYPLLVEGGGLQSRVVQLEFDWYADEYRSNQDPSFAAENTTTIQIGMHPFTCAMKVDEASAPPTASKLVRQEKVNWLTLSKFTSKIGACLWFRPGTAASGQMSLKEDWRYSPCIGREAVRYKPPRMLAVLNSTMIHLGYHQPEEDEVFLDGTVVQHYRSSTAEVGASEAQPHLRVSYECAPHSEFKVVNATDELIIVHSSSFCDWRPERQISSSEHTSSKPMSGKKLRLEKLIEEGIGKCHNITMDWWTYEYCHPDSLLQFHLEKNLGVRTPMFLLGSLGGLMKPAWTFGNEIVRNYPEPSPMFPYVRHPTLSKLNLNSTLFENLSMEVIVIPTTLLSKTNGMGLWAREAEAYGLALNLNRGSPCPSLPSGVRSARLIFFCPFDMAEAQFGKIRAIEEVRTCTYDVLVEHAGVCAHPQLRPPFMEIPTGITCARERHTLEHLTSGKLTEAAKEAQTSFLTGLQHLHEKTVAHQKQISLQPNALEPTVGGRRETLFSRKQSMLASARELRRMKAAFSHDWNWLPHSAGLELALKALSSEIGTGSIRSVQSANLERLLMADGMDLKDDSRSSVEK